jgi:hypothetical protein
MSIRKGSFAAVTILTIIGWGLAPAPAAGRALPQQMAQPAPSVADAARKARAEKKDEKSTKVYTNDDLDKLTGPISVVGVTPAPPTAAPAATAPAQAKAGAAATPKDEGYWRAQFAAARKTLADDAKELDVLQREYNLKEQQYYSNPDVAMREQYSRKDLDDTKTQIDAKQQDVAKDNQAISNLEDQLRQAGGDPGWEREQ